MIYVTSQPIHPRVLDYFFSLVPELDTPQARSRFDTVSLVDGRNEPLARKLLQRPARSAGSATWSANPEMAIMLPFCITEDEVELAVRLGLPIYGSDPATQLARDEDRAAGRCSRRRASRTRSGLDVDGEADVLAPRCASCARRSRRARRAIAEADQGVSGLGNAIVDLDARRATTCAARSSSRTTRPSRRVPRGVRPRGRDRRGADRGRRCSAARASSSASARPARWTSCRRTTRCSAAPTGMTYFGCHFPAAPEYAERLAAEALKVGRQARARGRDRARGGRLRRRARGGALAAVRRRDQPALRRDDASALRAARR